MGSAEGGSGGASKGGGDSGTGGNSGAGGAGTGCSSASRFGYRAAKKYMAYAGKKTVAGTHTRAMREIRKSRSMLPKIIARLIVVTFNPSPAALPATTATTLGTITTTAGMLAMMLNRLPAAIDSTSLSRR